jgi:orotate phosphoribosyltransferase-like protein
MTPAKETQARRALELRNKGLNNRSIAHCLGLSRIYVGELLRALAKLGD